MFSNSSLVINRLFNQSYTTGTIQRNEKLSKTIIFFIFFLHFFVINPNLGAKVQIMTNNNCKSYIIRTKRCLFFSIIGENGANLKLLMEGMHLRDRKSFVNNYINPNLSEGYIAMLYPEIPNHPMQSYCLTKKGRELLEHL